ncbi:MAG: hypothetical protein NTW86_18025 [Candidatus Sumerlaeota bacterium]|nr:hypothetical protein [Candidatus Sumerlaeota bacterium]
MLRFLLIDVPFFILFVVIIVPLLIGGLLVALGAAATRRAFWRPDEMGEREMETLRGLALDMQRLEKRIENLEAILLNSTRRPGP